MKTYHIVIHGYYGAGNYGDDIILLSMIESLLKLNNNLRFTVLSRDVYPLPENTYEINTVSRYDLGNTIEVIKKADMLICGGGGILQDYSGFDIYDHFCDKNKGLNYYALPVEIAYLLGKPVMIYGIGVGPLVNQISRRFVKNIIGWSNIITVRDYNSQKLLRNISPLCDPVVTADPAINYKQSSYSDDLFANKEKKYLGVCLRNWFMSAEEKEKFLIELVKIIDDICEREIYKIFLFPFNNIKSDLNMLNNLYQKIKHKERVCFVKSPSMTEAVNIISNLDLIIGMRLHSLIVAASNSVPAIGIAYDQKVSNFFVGLNMEKYVLSLNNFNYRNVIKRIYLLREEIDSYRKNIEEKMLSLKEKEKKNSHLALGLLREGG